MRARNSYSTISSVLLLSGLAFAMGCRGGKPLGSFVKVSKEPDAQLSDVEVPKQRLAINDRDSDEAEAAEREQRQLLASDDNPHVRPHQTLEQSRPDRRPESDTIAVGITDQTNEHSTSDRPDVNEVSVRISDHQSDEDLSPDVMELVDELLMRRMKAQAALTGQPGAVEFEAALKDLPDLPDSSDNPPSHQAMRLASMEFRQSMMEQKLAAMADEAIAQASVSDRESDERSVVQAISDQDPAETNGVQPAAANSEVADSQSDAAKISEDTATETPAAISEMSNQNLYQELVTRLNQSPLGETEADRNARIIKQRHLMMLAGNPDAAVEAIHGMNESEQEFLRHYLLGLWTMVDPNGHPVPGRRFTTALPEIREATKFAAAATDALEVDGLAFCERIESYGQTVPFEGNRFEPGQQVILYCEIDNFKVERTPKGYKTHIEGSYDIYNSNNEKVVSQALPSDEQISTNHLRDYFVAYKMYLPKELDAGTYRLQLTMADSIGTKYGQASIPFEITKK